MDFENLPMYLLLGIAAVCVMAVVYILATLLGMLVNSGAFVGLGVLVAGLVAMIAIGWIMAKVFHIDD